LERSINRSYFEIEKIIYISVSLITAIVCVVLFKQSLYLQDQVVKMVLVKQEYHAYLSMLKKNIHYKEVEQSLLELKNVDNQDSSIVSVDTIDDKSLVEQILLESDFDIDELDKEEDILSEQDEDTELFQFISPEDEKQLKDLRSKTRQALLINKKIKKKPQARKVVSSISYQQNVQKHFSSKSIVKDFTFSCPLELTDFWISSRFGARKKVDGSPGFHYGIDLAAMKGTVVRAAAAGTVIQAQYLPGYGNNILIQHNASYRTRYAHLHTINVSVGQKIITGQKIGTVGDTGIVRKNGHDASHLHFEIYHNGSHVNPLRYLFN